MSPVLQEQLPNGLVVMVQEDHRTPRVAIHVLLDAGAAEDPPGQSGLAHLVEHLLFPAAYDAALGEVGGTSNAWTDADHIALFAEAPAGAEDLLLRLESERLRGIVPDDGALALQREVVERERSREREPGGLAFPTLATLLWPDGHPYGRRVLGDPAEVASIGIDEVRAFVRAHVRPDAASLAIVGDFDGDEVMGKARGWLSGIPAPALPVAVAPRAGPEAGIVHGTLPADVERARTLLGWRIPARGDPDEPALDLTAALLDDPDHGAIVRAWAGERGGSLTAEVRGSLRRFERRLRRLARRGPDPHELSREQAWMRAEALRSTERIVARAETFNLCFAATGKGDCLAERIALHDAVTPDDVRRVAQARLRDGVILTVVPE